MVSRASVAARSGPASSRSRAYARTVPSMPNRGSPSSSSPAGPTMLCATSEDSVSSRSSPGAAATASAAASENAPVNTDSRSSSARSDGDSRS